MALTYYITDRKQLPGGETQQLAALREKVRAAFSAGVDYVQVREKDLQGRALAALVEQLASLPRPGGTRLLVNDRVDVAAACGADGTHLPADSLPPAAVRNRYPSKFLIGKSCHSSSEVEEATAAGADHVLVAPVFDTASKPGMQPMGLAAFAAICRRSTIPVLALGGVEESNARACLDAGAAGVAGIRLFQQADDISALVARLRNL